MFVFIIFLFLFQLKISTTYDDGLVTIDYTPIGDYELGKTIMLHCCPNGIGMRSGEVPDYKWERYIGETMSSTAIGINSHTLFLPNFTTTDIGLYRCKISSFRTKYSAYIAVGDTELLIAPGTISYSPEDYTTPLLKCIQGNGGVIDSFNYRFYRHHAPMPPQAYVNGRELYVPGFNEDDVGIYSCEAFNDKGISYGHPYEWYTDSTYEYSYYSYPNITLNAPIEEYKTGTIMALTCCSQFDLPSQYAWNKRNMITYDIEPLTNAMGEFSSTLYVPITGVEDSGVYICIAYNVGGVSVGEILIDLTPEGPPFFLTLSQSPIYIPQYVNKYIACVTGGDPYPSTSWRRINGTLPPNSAPNFDGLYLLSMEGSDVSGVYVCTASNVNGMIEAFFEVIYLSSITEAPTSATTATIATAEYDPPVNVTVTGQIAVVEGQDMSLNCSAIGDPLPTYQWLRSGDSLPDKVTTTNSPQLTVPSVTWSDVGVYYCLAVNTGGVSYSPAIYVLLQAEEGAIISYRKDQKESVNVKLLGGVLGGVLAVVIVLSLTATSLICYMSRPVVEHAVETSPRVWDVLLGDHKDKNMFDIIIKVEPRIIDEDTPREPSLISLTNHIMNRLNIVDKINRPFDCDSLQTNCERHDSLDINSEQIQPYYDDDTNQLSCETDMDTVATHIERPSDYEQDTLLVNYGDTSTHCEHDLLQTNCCKLVEISAAARESATISNTSFYSEPLQIDYEQEQGNCEQDSFQLNNNCETEKESDMKEVVNSTTDEVSQVTGYNNGTIQDDVITGELDEPSYMYVEVESVMEEVNLS